MNAARASVLSRDGGATADRPALVIGLVNNMPDAALEATERQFRSLLAAAAGGRPVELRLFALPEVPRGTAGRAYVETRYEGPESLRDSGLDGLIVTGTEPRSPRLEQEPYWGALMALIDWAQRHTVSSVMSCLAAHAAVLCLDGIERRRFPDKLFGVFPCKASASHPLTAGFGDARRVPHSRFNDLPEEKLASAGYQVLARADAVGADLFTKDCGSLFVFVQGHPEYDRRALMREYRRDVGRFLGREREHYPQLPQGYFDDGLARLLAIFQERALGQRDPGLLSQFPVLEDACLPEATWREEAVRLYANWLELLEQRKCAAARVESAMMASPLRAGLSGHGAQDASHGP